MFSKHKTRDQVLRRLLQLAVAVGGAVPVAAGLAGAVMGPGMVDSAVAGDVALDSHFRYLSGLLLGIGLGFWTTVPHIERKTARFQLLTAIVVAGGLGRLTSAMVLGFPDGGMLFGLGMELAVTPLLAVAQGLVARRWR